MDTSSHLLLTTPTDVLAAIPYLLGFHPHDSLVVIGLTGDPPKGRLQLTTRWDLPLDRESTDRLIPLLLRENVNRVIIVGYGPGARVTPAVDEIRALTTTAGLGVAEALRAEDGRFWSYICTRASCCPPEGTRYTPDASPIPAQATLNGMVALRDRHALEESIAPHAGAARRAMRAATAKVVAETLHRIRVRPDPDALAREIVSDGLAAVHHAIATYSAGRRLSDEQAARLGVALTVIRVRDEAWTLASDDALTVHQVLWSDLTRRLEPRFLPPAASLLALSAWHSGDCALAGIALRRALAADPDYSLANLLSHALHHMLSPLVLRQRMPTPADLDTAMGSPRMSWLSPMIALLEDEQRALTAPSDLDHEARGT